MTIFKVIFISNLVGLLLSFVSRYLVFVLNGCNIFIFVGFSALTILHEITELSWIRFESGECLPEGLETSIETWLEVIRVNVIPSATIAMEEHGQLSELNMILLYGSRV